MQKNQQKRHEKILKELEKRLEMEVGKNAKLAEAGKQKDEEIKTFTKVCVYCKILEDLCTIHFQPDQVCCKSEEEYFVMLCK